MWYIRDLQVLYLSGLVSNSQPERLSCVRQSLECLHLLGGEGAALQSQAGGRCRRQVPQIVRVDRAQVSFGRHMKPNRFDNVAVEVRGEPLRAQLFVLVIDPGLRTVLRMRTQQVTDIV